MGPAEPRSGVVEHREDVHRRIGEDAAGISRDVAPLHLAASLLCVRHRVRGFHDAEDEARYNEAVNGGGVAELVRLREAGFINEVSLGMNDAYFVQRMLDDNPHGTFDSVMMAGSWNLLDQDGLLVLLECQRRGVKVRVYFYYCTVN